MIPITVVEFGPEVEDSVLSVLRSGMLAQGPRVKELESRFAEMIGVDHVVAVNNGTTALIAALRVLDLAPGDEVITSPFTFVATLNAILDVGAVARFADISETDFNVNPAAVADLIDDRTRVLMPVHLYGQTADMGSIGALAAHRGLELVEDAAQAHGATFEGRSAGSWGIGCFSLYATKNLTSGEGGLVSTSDPRLADRLRLLRNQGMRERYQYEMAGNNYRMTDLQAAVCLPQLAAYGANIEARRRNAARLSERLADIPWITTPQVLPGREHVWHQYTVLVGTDAPVTRDELIAHLGAQGVGCGIYYPRLVFDYDCYADDPRVVGCDVPVARDVTARCVSLPVHPKLDEAAIDQIVAAVGSAHG
jgi:dTDP-4-amino-4,6-dideoxygalactose transaminase